MRFGRRGGRGEQEPAAAPVELFAEFEWFFNTRSRSLRPGLTFGADIRYEFALTSGSHGPPLHPHSVARCCLREELRQITSNFRPLDVREAEDAVNSALSQPLRTDPRIAVSAHVRLTLDRETEALARHQEHSEQHRVTADHDESVRLDLLHTRLLDPRLGLVWWLDKHADSLFSSDTPNERAKAVIDSFNTLHSALLRGRGEHPSAETALVRARVDELLTMLEDPDTASRAAGVLEQLVQIIHGEARGYVARPTE